MTQKHYTPRKKKIRSTRVIGAMKLVRIDHRTEISVPVDVPDDVAREKYLLRVQAAQEHAHGFKLGQKHIKKPEDSEEVPQKELAEVLDDDNLPEIE